MREREKERERERELRGSHKEVTEILEKLPFLNEHRSKIMLAHPTFISVTLRQVLIIKWGDIGYLLVRRTPYTLKGFHKYFLGKG